MRMCVCVCLCVCMPRVRSVREDGCIRAPPLSIWWLSTCAVIICNMHNAFYTNESFQSTVATGSSVHPSASPLSPTSANYNSSVLLYHQQQQQQQQSQSHMLCVGIYLIDE